MIDFNLSFIMELLSTYFMNRDRWFHDELMGKNRVQQYYADDRIVPNQENYTPYMLMNAALTLFHANTPPKYRPLVMQYYHNGQYRVVGGAMSPDDFWREFEKL